MYSRLSNYLAIRFGLKQQSGAAANSFTNDRIHLSRSSALLRRIVLASSSIVLFIIASCIRQKKTLRRDTLD